jgi:hypothetical protein
VAKRPGVRRNRREPSGKDRVNVLSDLVSEGKVAEFISMEFFERSFELLVARVSASLGKMLSGDSNTQKLLPMGNRVHC